MNSDSSQFAYKTGMSTNQYAYVVYIYICVCVQLMHQQLLIVLIYMLRKQICPFVFTILDVFLL